MAKKGCYSEEKKRKEQKEVNIQGRFILFKDKIIKVQEEDLYSYTGFDVFSENPFRIKKNNEAIELPEAVIKLIGCEKSRVQLADSLCKTRNDVCKLLNISERTVYRAYNSNGLHEEERILMKELKKPDIKNVKQVKRIVA